MKENWLLDIKILQSNFIRKTTAPWHLTEIFTVCSKITQIAPGLNKLSISVPSEKEYRS